MPRQRVAALFLCLAFVGACAEKKPEARPKVPVTLATVESRPAPYSLRANGAVEPMQSVGINSQVSGVLQHVGFKEGDEVRQGQVLFQIDPRPFRAALDAAEATLAKDVAQLENARRQAERYAALVKEKSVTEADAEQFAANARALAATVQADKAQIEVAQLNLDNATIRSPIGGRTGSLLVRQGNLVRALGTAPLVVINQLHPIAIRFAIPEREFPEVLRRSKGSELTVRAMSKDGLGKVLEGKLAFVDNAVDTLTGTVILKAHFTNDEGLLWPGQFVTVVLDLYVDQDATVVPADAVQTGQVGTYVFTVDSAGKAMIKRVTVGRTTENGVIISSGLQPGQKIVVDGQSRLSPGALVDIRQPATNAGAPPAGGDAAATVAGTAQSPAQSPAGDSAARPARRERPGP
ncbi:MAG: efflux RND transporter periplasmic adaptor subunit [Gemmatimonadetes bacterium]|nr:efflux RND transporter periplasmic adaptor subunit [Gemmatimonadota bacterium]